MATTVRPIPPGYHSVNAYLNIRGAADAIEFYKKAFEAKEIFRMPGPDGKQVMHAELQMGDSMLMLSDEFPEMGGKSPQALNGSPVTMFMYVEDVDKVFNRAVAAGAKATQPLKNMFWGDRYGTLTDPFGHRWALATHIEDVPPDELAQRAAKAFGG